MHESLDLRGFTCPEPVIRCKRLFERHEIDSFEALVDDEVCVSNLSRLAKSLNAGFSVAAKENYFAVNFVRHPDAAQAQDLYESNLPQIPKTESKTVVFINKDQFGQGDEDFSKSLLNIFLQTLFESGHRPKAILLANSGVRLMETESQVLKVLSDFKGSGCDVLACGLCVEYYGLKDQIDKEQITNMFAICEYLAAADKIISP